ncbi:alpha-xenorhabdolysin family binary toxin subunit A [Pseudomonas arsenicoxydans]|uniref:DNA-binding protein n=1 Tax=Pseudomonas arsenicoxydans TaxID=702115 RepID=A0A4P6FUR8_9PSED|nr:alpha-xenorhabdolysin family binary toxin subunit A [Pseudomonas arsenicoxydans]QAY82573.1 DNA-binding protein [Pseudomonas arsenicoxydans]
MTDNLLWEDALNNASVLQIAELAAVVPVTMVNASISKPLARLGSVMEVATRESGLLLTKKEIVNLRKYEALGLQLPYTLQAVIDYLRFGEGEDGGNGLTAEDFLQTFSITRKHAMKWSDIRSRVMLTSEHLKVFGTRMGNYGIQMAKFEDELAASGVLKKHDIKTIEDLDKLKRDLRDEFPDLSLGEDTIVNFKYVLNEIKKDIAGNLKNVEQIKVDLDSFGNELRLTVHPEIKHRLALISTNRYPQDVKDLDTETSRLSVQIAEKSTQYKALVEKSLGSAAALNIFGLGMAIYYGVEAEAIRKERDALEEALNRALAVLGNKNQTLARLKVVELKLQNLDFAAVHADVATKNLRHTWNVLHLYISNSYEVAGNITDAMRFRIFNLHFANVVNPWKDIVNDARSLNEIFKEADEEYIGGMTARKGSVMGVLTGNTYPVADSLLMKTSLSKMNTELTTASAIFTRQQYLPALKDTCVQLVRSVDSCAEKLTDAALKSSNELKTNRQMLMAVEADLASEIEGENNIDNIEDLLQERNSQLKKAIVKTVEMTKEIRKKVHEVSSGFDKATTMGYIAGLEKDKESHLKMIEQLQVALSQSQSEKKTISDAIEAIEKAGIEKIGKDVALTIDKLLELGMKPTELELVKFAIETVKKAIEDIGAGLRFIDMIRGSDAVQAKIDGFLNRIQSEKSKQTAADEKVKFIQAAHLIEDQRSVYVAEYQKAVESFELFVMSMEFDKFSDGTDYSAAFQKEAAMVINYLSPLSRP